MQSYHTLIVGASDGGKTTLLREMHDEFQGVSIWINHNDASNVAGYRTVGRKGMHTACARYESWSDVRINFRGDNPLEMMAEAVDFAADVWDTVGVPVQIIADEAHHIVGEGMGTARDNAGMWALAEGRDRGIKFVIATQNAQKLDYDELLNVKYWAWVGEYAKAQEGFINYWGFDKDSIPRERFQYTVYNRGMEKLYSGETKEKYGA